MSGVSECEYKIRVIAHIISQAAENGQMPLAASRTKPNSYQTGRSHERRKHIVDTAGSDGCVAVGRCRTELAEPLHQCAATASPDQEAAGFRCCPAGARLQAGTAAGLLFTDGAG